MQRVLLVSESLFYNLRYYGTIRRTLALFTVIADCVERDGELLLSWKRGK